MFILCAAIGFLMGFWVAGLWGAVSGIVVGVATGLTLEDKSDEIDEIISNFIDIILSIVQRVFKFLLISISIFAVAIVSLIVLTTAV